MTDPESQQGESRYGNWSNEQLVRAVTLEAKNHPPETLDEMRRELAGRGIEEEEWERMRALIQPDSRATDFAGSTAEEKKWRNGASWFYWLAGLSLVNSVIAVFGGEISFLFGLGFTQVADAIGAEVARQSPELATIARVVGLGVAAAGAGLFALFGWLAHQKKQWAFVSGLVLYAMDALLALGVGAYLSLAFHAWVLLALFQGMQALARIRKAAPAMEPVSQG